MLGSDDAQLHQSAWYLLTLHKIQVESAAGTSEAVNFWHGHLNRLHPSFSTKHCHAPTSIVFKYRTMLCFIASYTAVSGNPQING